MPLLFGRIPNLNTLKTVSTNILTNKKKFVSVNKDNPRTYPPKKLKIIIVIE